MSGNLVRARKGLILAVGSWAINLAAALDQVTRDKDRWIGCLSLAAAFVSLAWIHNSIDTLNLTRELERKKRELEEAIDELEKEDSDG